MNELDAKGRIAFLDGIRAVAILMVVGQHALAYNQLEASTRSELASWFQIAVPIFFMVDGFLFLFRLGRHGRLNYREYLRASAVRLLFPWAVFSFLYLIVRLLYEHLGSPGERIILYKDLPDVVVAIWVGAPAGQMYFLVSLFLLRTLAPAVRFLQTTSPTVSFASVVLASFLWSAMDEGIALGGIALKADWGGGQDPLLHAIWGLQYYLLGCNLYLHHTWLLKHARPVATGILCVFAGLRIGNVNSALLQQYAYLLCVYFLFLAFERPGSFLSVSGRYTMGVYLLHFPAIMKLVSVALAQVLDVTRLWYYWLVVAGTLMLSVTITCNLMSTRYLHYLFGETKRLDRPWRR